MGTPVNIIVGSQVWVEDPEDAWIDGEVTEINGKNVTITATNGKTLTHEAHLLPSPTAIPRTRALLSIWRRHSRSPLATVTVVVAVAQDRRRSPWVAVARSGPSTLALFCFSFRCENFL
ncbi:hypothetical protein V8G54_027075 [Vigna mungo]|uniref:Myosin N-terminal SH3-like domain-containing protein n=1 Tax=Vigna mungo TaxID=3915 RepID=A0AAQ3RR17_VIGMU